MRRPVEGKSMLDPEPDRRLHRQPRKVGRRNPRGLAGLVQITARNAVYHTGPEQQRELLADLTVRGADHVAGTGEQTGEPGDEHLHAGLFGGLPDGGLPDVDPTSRQLPGAAVTAAHE